MEFSTWNRLLVGCHGMVFLQMWAHNRPIECFSNLSLHAYENITVQLEQYRLAHNSYWESTEKSIDTGRPVDAVLFPVGPHTATLPESHIGGVSPTLVLHSLSISDWHYIHRVYFDPQYSWLLRRCCAGHTCGQKDRSVRSELQTTWWQRWAQSESVSVKLPRIGLWLFANCTVFRRPRYFWWRSGKRDDCWTEARGRKGPCFGTGTRRCIGSCMTKEFKVVTNCTEEKPDCFHASLNLRCLSTW